MLILILSTWKFKLMLVISCAMLKIIPERGKNPRLEGCVCYIIQFSVAHMCVYVCVCMCVCVCVCMPIYGTVLLCYPNVAQGIIPTQYTTQYNTYTSISTVSTVVGKCTVIIITAYRCVGHANLHTQLVHTHTHNAICMH